MTSLRGTPRLPPADLSKRVLTDLVVQEGGDFWRISHEAAPLVDWSKNNGEARFSHAAMAPRVFYLARTKETAFWERFGEELRDQPVDDRAVSEKMLRERVWKDVRFAGSPLRCLDLRNDKILRRIGADGATFLAAYDITLEWAKALAEHPVNLDGLIYSSRLDTPEPCLALFERPHLTGAAAPFSTTVSPVRPLVDPELLAVLAREKIGILRAAP